MKPLWPEVQTRLALSQNLARWALAVTPATPRLSRCTHRTSAPGPKLPTSSGGSGATGIEGATDTLVRQQILEAITLPPMGSRWLTGSASRGLDRFAGIVSCGQAGTVIYGREAENVIGRLGGLHRRAYWRGCPREVDQICALLVLTEQAGPRLCRCRRYRP